MYTVKCVNALFFNNPGLNLFIDVIYKNFIELSKFKILKHTKEEIYRLLKSPLMRGYLVYNDDKKVIAYLIGEEMLLADGRQIFYISYLFVSPLYRRAGIASGLLDKTIEKYRVKGFDGTMLICDTEDIKVYDFYLKRGYTLDIVLRRYDRYDVLSLMFV